MSKFLIAVLLSVPALAEAGKKAVRTVAQAEECSNLRESTMWYGTQIDGDDYKVTSIYESTRQKCIAVSSDSWTSYSPSLVAAAAVPAATLDVEAGLCRKAIQDKYVKKYVMNHWRRAFYFQLSNANQSGKLIRPIVCAPEMFEDTLFPTK